jgi:hypothetical protein
MLLAMAAGVASPVTAQELDVGGWRAYSRGHFILYAIDGTPGARDVATVAVELERIYSQVLEPLKLPPVTILYPLYPSTDKFQSDWWQFAIRDSGEIIHGWGAIYGGQPGGISPYVVTRAVIAHTFPRVIPLLKWGLGDALGDRMLGIDSHYGLQALLGAGWPLPALEAIVPPYDFGTSLPTSYPAAVSFVAFLLDEYGLAQTAAFINTIGFRYYDFGLVFQSQFGRSLTAAERAWRQRLAAHVVSSPSDMQTYLRGVEFVVSTTLASNPGRSMLRSEGALIVAEAFSAILPVRTLNLASIDAHLAAVRAAEVRRQSRARWTTFAVRGGFWFVILAPIVLALGLLTWPKIRARLSKTHPANSSGVS